MGDGGDPPFAAPEALPSSGTSRRPCAPRPRLPGRRKDPGTWGGGGRDPEVSGLAWLMVTGTPFWLMVTGTLQAGSGAGGTAGRAASGRAVHSSSGALPVANSLAKLPSCCFSRPQKSYEHLAKIRVAREAAPECNCPPGNRQQLGDILWEALTPGCLVFHGFEMHLSQVQGMEKV